MERQFLRWAQIQEVAEEQGSGTGASLTVVQRLFDAQDRYVEDEATGAPSGN